ncbi:PhzF family phenazine biosynthesis protein [Clostridium sp. D33t1_170424_F3]|uniref:PhzF family phenazine biosynthesis protein n=1 Tax=Clostridium sp. D33t1_170424_F3 TaxID=2787099 RepID=UPI001A9BD5E7|nr:PhzF family phenazine biosynthesis protein [Clostridium sp. D33t1_170424_F3]
MGKNISYYVVDAFTGERFHGNPAGVCVLDEPLDAALMQRIAAENNLPETAFLLKRAGGYSLRWFTPKFEIDLCGHATLAASFVVFNELEPALQSVAFSTMSGMLTVARSGRFYEMSFPSRPARRIDLTAEQRLALGCAPEEVYAARDLLLVLRSESDVREYVPDYDALQKPSGWLGVVVTAPGREADFVSRYFCPELRAEDPVTGSAHCSLVPYWAERLGKDRLTAEQFSERRGTLHCVLMGDRVRISGEAVLYLRGKLCI